MIDPFSTDLALLEAARQGDTTARLTVVDRCRVPIELAAAHILGPTRYRTDGQEVVQASFLELLDSSADFRGECSLVTFARRLAQNKARQFLSKLTHTPLLPSDPLEADSAGQLAARGPDHAEQIEVHELVERLEQGLRTTLSPRLFLCYQLLFRDELEVPDVAELLDTNANNVYQMKNYVKKQALHIRQQLLAGPPLERPPDVAYKVSS